MWAQDWWRPVCRVPKSLTYSTTWYCVYILAPYTPVDALVRHHGDKIIQMVAVLDGIAIEAHQEIALCNGGVNT